MGLRLLLISDKSMLLAQYSFQNCMNYIARGPHGALPPNAQLHPGRRTLLGRSHILPNVKALLGQFPDMEIDLQIGDRYIDLVEEGIDLAIRIDALKDSALKARRVGTAHRVCVASQDYLAEHAQPMLPDELQNHNCIVYTLASAGNIWSFRGIDVTVRGRFRVNTPDGIRSAVLDGIGIAYAPAWLFEDAIRDGRVKSLLVEHCGPLVPIHIVYAANRLLPSRARVFMDFIAAAFARDTALNVGSAAA
jgi:LysR family transcriptional regulator for bpeEF and oprC